MIKRVTLSDDFDLYTRLLNQAFATVAEEFGLTRENAPTNNAFITAEILKSQLTDKREFYYFSEIGDVNGFIAIEKSSRSEDVFYIEKLAVAPLLRHKGIGRKLMDFATERIKQSGGRKISIGLIDSNQTLKKWYQLQGFKEIEIKTYDHLPFDVCLMEKVIS